MIEQQGVQRRTLGLLPHGLMVIVDSNKYSATVLAALRMPRAVPRYETIGDESSFALYFQSKSWLMSTPRLLVVYMRLERSLLPDSE